MYRNLVTLLLAVALAVASGPGATGAGVTVMGYYPVYGPGDNLAHLSLVRSRAVSAVGAFLYSIDAQGLISRQAAPGLMELARERDLKVYALVHNTDSGGFSRWAATQILTDQAVRTRAIDGIVKLVETGGYDGIHVDLENVSPVEREHLTSFMRDLATRLQPLGYEVGMAVPAKTWDDPRNGWSGAFDYRALGQIIDHVTIMAYDEHWPGGTAGPVASLPWVASVVSYAASVIPADKILLGLAAYGYDWPAGGTGARALTSTRAASLAEQMGVPVRWDQVAGVPFFHYTTGGGGRIVYFENAQSTQLKIGLVGQYGLGGVAIWRLGIEDPAIWPLMDDLRHPIAAGNGPTGGSEPSIIYVVNRGDTVSGLAGRFGVSAASIVTANSLVNPDLLVVGQRLIIPGRADPTTVHTVRPGESLWLIATVHGTTWQTIVRANGLRSTTIHPGQNLIIPGAGTAFITPKVHVVSRGESLWLIATRYGTTWQAIAQINGLTTTAIFPGQRLIIP